MARRQTDNFASAPRSVAFSCRTTHPLLPPHTAYPLLILSRLPSTRYTTQFLLSALAAAQFPAPDGAGDRFPRPLQRRQIQPAQCARRRKGRQSLVRRRAAHAPSISSRFSIRASRPKLVFADLPGYGYAKISKSISAGWPAFIEPYLAKRSTLRALRLPGGLQHPAAAERRQLLDWLRAAGRDFAVVATKIDRLSGNERTRNLLALKKGLELDEYPARLRQDASLRHQSKLWSRD